MGPRFFKRGEVERDRFTGGGRHRFNGATLFQAWRDGNFEQVGHHP